MRRFFQISALILVYFIVCGKSCDSNEQLTREQEKNRATRDRDSITSVFQSDSLDQPALRAFEATACIKLGDLCDYLKVMNDSTADKAFKEKAGAMALALCYPGKEVTARMKGVVVDSIRVFKTLQRLSDSVYYGQLSFMAAMPDARQAVRNHSQPKTRFADIFALKQDKVFGRDTLKIWNVLIGDIR